MQMEVWNKPCKVYSILASSSIGFTSSVKTLEADLLPPKGLTNTNSFFGRPVMTTDNHFKRYEEISKLLISISPSRYMYICTWTKFDGFITYSRDVCLQHQLSNQKNMSTAKAFRYYSYIHLLNDNSIDLYQKVSGLRDFQALSYIFHTL